MALVRMVNSEPNPGACQGQGRQCAASLLPHYVSYGLNLGCGGPIGDYIGSCGGPIKGYSDFFFRPGLT